VRFPLLNSGVYYRCRGDRDGEEWRDMEGESETEIVREMRGDGDF